jgi:hypothetical protein
MPRREEDVDETSDGMADDGAQREATGCDRLIRRTVGVGAQALTPDFFTKKEVVKKTVLS